MARPDLARLVCSLVFSVHMPYIPSDMMSHIWGIACFWSTRCLRRKLNKEAEEYLCIFYWLLFRGLCWCWIADMRPDAKYLHPCFPRCQCWYLEFDKEDASGARNANKEVEEYLSIFCFRGLCWHWIGSGNEARCQIHPTLFPSMPMLIFEIW